MRPVLFELGDFKINSWGVMVAVALLLAAVVLRHELERLTGRGDAAYPLVLAAGVGGLFGARLYRLAEHAGDASLLDAFSGAGFTWYGGVLGGATAVLLVARVRRVALGALLGASAPALALGYGIGRIACQLAGDGTYGVRSDLPWAMSYPNGEAPTTERVHPTPVYETLASLLIFAVLWRACVAAGNHDASSPPTSCLPAPSASSSSSSGATARYSSALTQPQLFAFAMMAGGLMLMASRGIPVGGTRREDRFEIRATHG